MRTRPSISFTVLFATIVLFMPAHHTLAAGPVMKVVQSPNEITWAPAPASLPSGAQLAVISGDASKRGGTYALRLKVPDGYVFKPHWHPQNVNVTVLSVVSESGWATSLTKVRDKSSRPAGIF